MTSPVKHYCGICGERADYRVARSWYCVKHLPPLARWTRGPRCKHNAAIICGQTKLPCAACLGLPLSEPSWLGRGHRRMLQW
jgi:hypothetical protein